MTSANKDRLINLLALALVVGVLSTCISLFRGPDRMPAIGPPLEEFYWTVRHDRLELLAEEVEKFGRDKGTEIYRSTLAPDIGVGFQTFILFVTRVPLSRDLSNRVVWVRAVRVEGVDPDQTEVASILAELKLALSDFEGLGEWQPTDAQ